MSFERVEQMISRVIDPNVTTQPLKDLLVAFLRYPEVASRLETAPASTALRYHHAYPGGLLDHIEDTFRWCVELTPNSLAKPVLQHCDEPDTRGIRLEDLAIVAALHDAHKIGDAARQPNYVENVLKKGPSRAEPFAVNNQVYEWTALDHAELIKGAEMVSTHAPHTQAPDPAFLGIAGAGYMDDWESRALAEALYLAREFGSHAPGGMKSLALVRAYSPALFNVLTEDQKYAIRFHDGAYGTGAKFSMGEEIPLQIIFHAADMLSSRLSRGLKGQRNYDLLSAEDKAMLEERRLYLSQKQAGPGPQPERPEGFDMEEWRKYQETHPGATFQNFILALKHGYRSSETVEGQPGYPQPGKTPLKVVQEGLQPGPSDLGLTTGENEQAA